MQNFYCPKIFCAKFYTVKASECYSWWNISLKKVLLETNKPKLMKSVHLSYQVVNLRFALIYFSDSVYSERYMGQPGPGGNFGGYQESDIIHRYADQII